jgi:hypothetical protein
MVVSILSSSLDIIKNLGHIIDFEPYFLEKLIAAKRLQVSVWLNFPHCWLYSDYHLVELFYCVLPFPLQEVPGNHVPEKISSRFHLKQASTSYDKIFKLLYGSLFENFQITTVTSVSSRNVLNNATTQFKNMSNLIHSKFCHEMSILFNQLKIFFNLNL